VVALAAVDGTAVSSLRIHSLHGLRGVAAAVVLIHHALLLMPSMLAPYRDPHPVAIGDLIWWLTYTPLHLLWDGSVAVIVFFVLSGFVLCLPAAQRGNPSWLAYYPKRLVRLYIPVIGAILLSVLWLIVVPRDPGASVSDWVSGHKQNIDLRDVLRDAVLIVGQPGATNSALWSLRWEVVFSLLLPLFLIFAAKAKRLLGLKIFLIVAALALGALMGPADKPYQMSFLFQLPVFAVGCLMAFEWERIGRMALRLNEAKDSRTLWSVLVFVTVILLSSYWLLYSSGLVSPLLEYAAPVSRVLQVLGAACLLFIAALWKPLAGFLTLRPNKWLGTRSFSLYLVHEPLVVAGGFAFAGLIGGIWPLFILVLAALILADIFFRVVERPSHLLAQKIGKKLSRGSGTLAK
jgi:peptidoglycan/LPS O-acetylase OafA/YrhL